MARVSWQVIGTASALALVFLVALYYLVRRARVRPAPEPPRAEPRVLAQAEPAKQDEDAPRKKKKRRSKTSDKARASESFLPSLASDPGLPSLASDPALPSLASDSKLPVVASSLPSLVFNDEDATVEPTRVGVDAADAPANVASPIKAIIFDEDAAPDEPTQSSALMLVSATSRTDVGLRRRRNEDAILEIPVDGVFVVADGMGGYRGGDIASSLAVRTIARAFEREVFDGPAHEGIPRRASELARAIQMANAAIRARADTDAELEGMGTTVCAARFAANKQRLYIGHVGDSRMYRFRAGSLQRLTSDHTMRDLGVEGEAAGYLSRAVGIWPVVPVDLLFCKPVLGDVYLLCSDGLTKMMNDESICEVMKSGAPPARLVRSLVDGANAKGGKDNISVIIIRVQDIGSSE